MRCDYVNITGLALAHVNSVAAAPDVYAPPLGANLAEALAIASSATSCAAGRRRLASARTDRALTQTTLAPLFNASFMIVPPAASTDAVVYYTALVAAATGASSFPALNFAWGAANGVDNFYTTYGVSAANVVSVASSGVSVGNTDSSLSSSQKLGLGLGIGLGLVALVATIFVLLCRTKHSDESAGATDAEASTVVDAEAPVAVDAEAPAGSKAKAPLAVYVEAPAAADANASVAASDEPAATNAGDQAAGNVSPHDQSAAAVCAATAPISTLTATTTA